MRILVGYVTQLHSSGVDKYILNILNIAKKQGVFLDFLTSQYDADTENFLSQQGCRLFAVHNLKNPFAHYRDVKSVLQHEKYDRAYFNISEPLNMMGVKAAHDCGVTCIVHSHSSGMDTASRIKRSVRGMINAICRLFLSRSADLYVACSRKAGEWMYTRKVLKGDKYRTIYNAVDVSRFCFDPDVRNAERERLGVGDDTVVVGHVGSYCYAKNNFFLVDITKELVKKHSDTVMLCVGDGADLEAVREYAKNSGVADKMRFVGVSRQIPALLCAMDVFVLPSRFEGAPTVTVEAQANGLPCIISDRVTEEVVISSDTIQLPINNPRPWADAIFSMCRHDRGGILPEFTERYSLDRQQKQIIEILFR